MHNRHRPVPHFGGGEGFALQLAGFLAFQRRFLRDGQSGTASDDKQPFARRERFHCRRPVGVGRPFQFVRQLFQRVAQAVVIVPMGEQVQAEGDGGDKTFGGGDAFFFARLHRQRPLAGIDQRRRHHVYQRGRFRPARLQCLHHRYHVRRTARLRRRQREVILYLPRCLQHAAERRRQRRHCHAPAVHQQVAEIAERVVGGSAPDRDRAARRRHFQFLRQCDGVAHILTGDNGSGFARFL